MRYLVLLFLAIPSHAQVEIIVSNTIIFNLCPHQPSSSAIIINHYFYPHNPHLQPSLSITIIKDCKPATLPDLPLAFVTNLQYNVASKYHHHHYWLMKRKTSGIGSLCELVLWMDPHVRSIRTRGDETKWSSINVKFDQMKDQRLWCSGSRLPIKWVNLSPSRRRSRESKTLKRKGQYVRVAECQITQSTLKWE